MNIGSIRTKFTWGRLALLLLGLFFLVNLLILDYKVFTTEEQALVTPATEEIREGEVLPSSQPIESNLCPPACLEAIIEATRTGLVQTTPFPVTTKPMVKEYYIPLGAGSTASQTWAELNGVESVIDMANYPNIKSIIFEASMRIPTANGRVHAKLYNVTEQHDVWYSEVSSEGPVCTREESKNITLGSGRKLYRVMMKSTMSYEAILDSARIKILLE